MKAAKDDSGKRLDRLLQEREGCSLRGARRLVDAQRVLVNGRVRPALYRVREGDAITILPDGAGGSFPEKTGTGDAYPLGLVTQGPLRGLAFFHKPPGLHSANISGAPSASLESMLPLLWDALTHQLAAGQIPAGQALDTETSIPMTGPEHAGTHPFAAAALPHLPSPLASGIAFPGGLSAPPAVPPLFPPRSMPRLLTRLDARTSGIVAAALTEEAAIVFRALEAAGDIDKYYLALVRGEFPAQRDLCWKLDTAKRRVTRVIDDEDGDPARATRIIPLSPPGTSLPRGTGLVLARIRRGARHQIRAHLAYAGFPLAGDALYSGEEKADSIFFLHHLCMHLPGVTVPDLSLPCSLSGNGAGTMQRPL